MCTRPILIFFLPTLLLSSLAHRGASSGDVRRMERGAAPAGRARNPALGRPGAPPGGHYGPPAESRLISGRQCPVESAAWVRQEAAVERRKARRPASLAG